MELAEWTNLESLCKIKTECFRDFIKYWMDLRLIYPSKDCPTCKNKAKLTYKKVKYRIDYFWLCQKRNPKHHHKFTIYSNSIFENSHINKRLLLFILIHCFPYSLSLKEEIITIKEQIQMSISYQALKSYHYFLRRILWKYIQKEQNYSILKGNSNVIVLEIYQEVLIEFSYEEVKLIGIHNKSSGEIRAVLVKESRSNCSLSLRFILKNIFSENKSDFTDLKHILTKMIILNCSGISSKLKRDLSKYGLEESPFLQEQIIFFNANNNIYGIINKIRRLSYIIFGRIASSPDHRWHESNEENELFDKHFEENTIKDKIDYWNSWWMYYLYCDQIKTKSFRDIIKIIISIFRVF